MTINFIDLQAQRQRLKTEIDTGIATVLEHGRFVFGPEVQEFEQKMADFGGAKHVVSCANGTDALLLSLMRWEIGAGDAVFCPSFTFCATAEIIANLGATPVFVDIDRRTYNLDPNSVQRAIDEVKSKGDLIPRAIIAVDLFGQSADYPALSKIAKNEGLKLVSDSAQGFGTTWDGKQPLHWADMTTTSFFPAKPLGCYGDGGALLTNDDGDDEVLRSLRLHGKGEDKYDNVRVGVNSRLDTIQAAILLPKLAIFGDEIKMRNRVAERYIDGLASNKIRVPFVPENVVSTWAQFTIEVDDPIGFGAILSEQGIPTARYYPKPVHVQTAYADYPVEGGALSVTDSIADKIISLPMHPYLGEKIQDFIMDAAAKA